jgi:hypothetical protein
MAADRPMPGDLRAVRHRRVAALEVASGVVPGVKRIASSSSYYVYDVM